MKEEAESQIENGAGAQKRCDSSHDFNSKVSDNDTLSGRAGGENDFGQQVNSGGRIPLE